MIINTKEIEKLIFENNISAYSIERDTGVSRVTINELRKGERDIENIPLKNIIKLQKYINNKENAKMNLESVNTIIYDEANNWYEIELMTEDNKLAYIRVDADDHPEAESDEHYFDDKELIEKIIDEALEDGEVIYE